ncbi:hypothetical protein IWZ01DRAFT_568964 [Phyllosticta capitalensis]
MARRKKLDVCGRGGNWIVEHGITGFQLTGNNVNEEKGLSYEVIYLWRMADSLYEYFQGIPSPRCQKVHVLSPLNPQNLDLLFSGTVRAAGGTKLTLEPEGQHLTCFAGGMVGIAAKISTGLRTSKSPAQMTAVSGLTSRHPRNNARNLASGSCGASDDDCKWNQTRWYESVGQHHGKTDRQVIKDISKVNISAGFTAYTDG